MNLLRLFFGIQSMPGILTLLILLSGCKKGYELIAPTASVRIVHVIPSLPFLYTSFQGANPLTFYANAAILSNTNSNNSLNYFNRLPGVNELAFYRATDTANPKAPYYKLEVDLEPNKYYSLFITGTVNDPDTLFLKEHFKTIKDSTTGIRFINLSPGSADISVNVVGMANGSTVSGLAYKQASEFVSLPAHSEINNYIFEFRDLSSGTLLLSYTTSKINQYLPVGAGAFKNLWLFRNTTLMVTGLPGGIGENALKIQLINH